MMARLRISDVAKALLLWVCGWSTSSDRLGESLLLREGPVDLVS
jgi:hypothetical protein